MLAGESDKQGVDIESDGNRRISHDESNKTLAKTGTEGKEKLCQDYQNTEIGMLSATTDTIPAMSVVGNVPSVDVAREYIRLQIARLGLTERDFCLKVGIPQSSINDILKNKRRAHFDHLDKINRALGIGTSSMFKVMCEIAREIEGSSTGYVPVPGRARGYVIADQKEAVRTAIKGMKRGRRPHEKNSDED